jgi:hypothetical protein
VLDIERSVGANISEHSGEWTDWWANGVASGPREVAASRSAKRSLAAAASPVWGTMPEEPRPAVRSTYHDLCLFDEHTWGANISVSQPYDLQTLGQFNEKALLAYRPMGHAEALVGRRARTATAAMGEGLFVANTAPKPFTGWVAFAAGALRGDFKSLDDPKTGRTFALAVAGGRARFWVDALPPHSVTQLRLRIEPAPEERRGARLTVAEDERGWPQTAQWPGMPGPLFSKEFGNFLSAQINPPAHRGTPEAVRRKSIQQTEARYRAAQKAETPQTLVFTQEFEHPRLDGATRTLELHKHGPRAHLAVRLNRTSSVAPEVFYLAFGFPTAGALPVFSNGGVPFTPYHDQLTGTCSDYYSIDSWAQYRTNSGNWLWVTRDAPLVSVGGPHTLARRTTPPDDSHRLLAMVFDNMWHTNFVADSHGWMEFHFDAVWSRETEDPDGWAETLTSQPVVVINSASPEYPVFLSTLFRP